MKRTNEWKQSERFNRVTFQNDIFLAEFLILPLSFYYWIVNFAWDNDGPFHKRDIFWSLLPFCCRAFGFMHLHFRMVTLDCGDGGGGVGDGDGSIASTKTFWKIRIQNDERIKVKWFIDEVFWCNYIFLKTKFEKAKPKKHQNRSTLLYLVLNQREKKSIHKHTFNKRINMTLHYIWIVVFKYFGYYSHFFCNANSSILDFFFTFFFVFDMINEWTSR